MLRLYSASFIIVLVFACLLPVTGRNGKKKTDIFPGKCISGLCIGDSVALVLQEMKSQKAADYKVVKPPKSSRLGDIFQHVFQEEVPYALLFDKMHVFDRLIIASLRGKIVALIGLEPGVTNSGVDLKKGVGHFLFKYGNKGLKQIQGSSNSMYVYKDLGIAVVDDGNDDVIDLYIVFRPQ